MDQSVVQKSLSGCKKWLLAIPLALGLAGCGSTLMASIVPGAVTAGDLEQAASLQYNQLVNQAKQQRAPVADNNAQNKRLQAIAQRLMVMPHLIT